MEQFGEPQRSATSDANAGVVDKPSKPMVARKLSAKKAEDTGVNLAPVGNAIGEALQKYMDTETKNLLEQRALDAAIRQGSEHAVNAIDAEKKRSGWEEGLFGQDVEYASAQRRGVQNAVNSTYLEQSTLVDSFAGESSERYSERLKESLDKMLEPYGDDAETRRMATATWMTASAKLTSAHAKAHYGYNQMQQRDTTEKMYRQAADSLLVDESNASNKEEFLAVDRQWAGLFNGALKPEGMSDIADRGAINNELNHSLRNGNVGFYKAAQTNGWIDGLNAAERAQLDQSISVYDTDFSQRVSTLYEEAQLAAVTSPEDAVATYHTFDRELAALAERSSGTDRAQLALARKFTASATETAKIYAGEDAAKRALDKEKKKVADKLAEDAAEAEQEKQLLNRNKLAIRLAQQNEPGMLIDQRNTSTKSELEGALDSVLMDTVIQSSGGDLNMTSSDAVDAILRDPVLANQIARKVESTPNIDSPLVQGLATTFMSSWRNTANEDGLIGDEGIKSATALAQFKGSQLKNLLGEDYDNYLMVQRGIEARQTVKMIDSDIENYNNNKADQAGLRARWFLGDETVHPNDWLRSFLKEETGMSLYDDELGWYSQELHKGMIIHKNNKLQAKEYLRTSIDSRKVSYNGKTIPGGARLNDTKGYGFSEIMDGAQRADVNLMAPELAAMFGDTRNQVTGGDPLSNLNEVYGLVVYTKPGFDGFFMDAPSAQAERYISKAKMESWADVITTRNKLNAIQDNAEKVAGVKRHMIKLQSRSRP